MSYSFSLGYMSKIDLKKKSHLAEEETLPIEHSVWVKGWQTSISAGILAPPGLKHEVNLPSLILTSSPPRL